MRRVRYHVACSLDGFIAGSNGEFDWIVADPEIDFAALFRQFDTAVIGRGTFEFMLKHGNTYLPGLKMVVASRTLRRSDYPEVSLVADAGTAVAELRSQPGKDIWVFGGANLFSSLADRNLVDTVEVAIMPVLLGRGTPLASHLESPRKLTLRGQKIYNSGVVSLEYAMA
jgi:dihydrofolate reductase